MGFYKDKITIDLSEDYTSDWIYLDEYKSFIDEFVVSVNFSSVTGTADGTIKVEQLFEDDELEDFDVLHTFNIDDTSGKSTIRSSVDCIAVRLVYTKNNITGGSAGVSLILSGKF